MPSHQHGLVDDQDGAAGGHHRPVQHVLQLGDVARPAVLDQPLERIVGEPFDHPSRKPRPALDEVRRQGGDVLASLRQGRQPELPAAEPPVQLRGHAADVELVTALRRGGDDSDAGLRPPLRCARHAREVLLGLERKLLHRFRGRASRSGRAPTCSRAGRIRGTRSLRWARAGRWPPTASPVQLT